MLPPHSAPLLGDDELLWFAGSVFSCWSVTMEITLCPLPPTACWKVISTDSQLWPSQTLPEDNSWFVLLDNSQKLLQHYAAVQSGQRRECYITTERGLISHVCVAEVALYHTYTTFRGFAAAANQPYVSLVHRKKITLPLCMLSSKPLSCDFGDSSAQTNPLPSQCLQKTKTDLPWSVAAARPLSLLSQNVAVFTSN